MSAGTLVGAANAVPATTALTVNGGTFDLDSNSQTVAGFSDGGVITGAIANSNSGSVSLTITQAAPAPSLAPSAARTWPWSCKAPDPWP